MTRREMLGLGAVAGAAILGSGATAAAMTESKTAPAKNFPWPYKELDIDATRKRAYDNYFKGGCMFGVFEAVAGGVSDRIGKPWSDFPFQLSTYGGGGVALWGTLCGTCNGAAMAVSMFLSGKIRNQVISEIFAWYENTALPAFVPEKPKKVKPDFQMKPSLAQSTLCHVSITRWCNASGFQSFSPQRVERCARLVADMAGYTAQLLNMAAKNEFKSKIQLGAVANGCLECHAKGNQAPNEPEVVSKMSCTACHPDAHNQEEMKKAITEKK